jgi:hypothetical protein
VQTSEKEARTSDHYPLWAEFLLREYPRAFLFAAEGGGKGDVESER